MMQDQMLGPMDEEHALSVIVQARVQGKVEENQANPEEGLAQKIGAVYLPPPDVQSDDQQEGYLPFGL